MKSRLKRQRYAFQPDRTQSQLAEKVLHQESDNLEYAPYSKSFAYTQLFNLGKEAISLSMWNEQQVKEREDDGEGEGKPRSELRRGKVTVRMDASYRQRQSITQHGSSRSLQAQQKRMRGKPLQSRARCALSLISPKLDGQKLQPKAKEPDSNKNSSCFLSSQMRESVRDRKKMIIKKIKRDPGLAFDSLSLQSPSLSHAAHLTQRKTAASEEKRATHRRLKACSEVDLKFIMNSSGVDILKSFRKIERGDATLKVSRINPAKNGHLFRGRNFARPEKSSEGKSRIESSEQFRKLKRLLERQKLKTTQESFV